MKRSLEKHKSDQSDLFTEITEGIYRLMVRFPHGMGGVNSYLIQGERGFTVIDTGSYEKEAIETWEYIIASGIIVEKVVITHAHPDHIGLAKWFQEQHHVPVYLPKPSYKEIQRILRNETGEMIHSFFQKHDGPEIPKGYLSFGSTPYDFEPEDLLDNRQKVQFGIDMYEAIWTPGHSPDHFCFYNQGKQVMVIGDHVLDNISPVIGVWSQENENPLQDYFHSLKEVKKYSTKLALPGHGGIIENLESRVDDIVSRHNHRLNQTLKFVKEEGRTAGQVCHELYGDLNLGAFFSPLMSTITRFIYLESIGKVYSETRNGKIFYQSVS